MSTTGRTRTPGRHLPVPWPDIVLAGALVASAVVATAQDSLATHPYSELAAATMPAALVVRSRFPFAMAVVATLGATATALLPNAATPLWMFLTILMVCFSVGANLDGRRRWVALGLLLAACYAIQLASVDRNDPSDNAFSEVFVSPLVIIGGPALAGALLRRARQQTTELQRLGAELAAEREQHAEAAAAAERGRIARELHDVVSHAVTVMVVQAGAAEQLLAADEPARSHVHAVRQTGKQALGELRRQLGLMREGAPSSATPLPSLDQIPDLVASSGAGFVAEEGAPTAVAPGLGLTAYRVVQEALTNAQRHAPGAPVAVRLSGSEGWLEVRVVDDGPGASTAHGAGVGLRGMRERVEMYGGCLDVGPRADAQGWSVHARLPVTQTREQA
jgi:signal transduction histidine kinase